MAEYKYRDSFDVTPFARLVFSANHPPRSGDASHAFYRRWLVVPFDRTFEPHEQRPRAELDAELSDPRELSGVLNKALEGLKRIRERGRFTESPSMKEAHEEFRRATDPLSVWLDRNTLTHPAAIVARDELMQRYARACEEAGRPVPSRKAFYKDVRNSRPGLEEAYRTWKGVSNVRVWVGLGLREGNPGGPDGGPQHPQDPQHFTNCFVQHDTQKQKTNREKAADAVEGVEDEEADGPHPSTPLGGRGEWASPSRSSRYARIGSDAHSPPEEPAAPEEPHPLDCECIDCSVRAPRHVRRKDEP